MRTFIYSKNKLFIEASKSERKFSTGIAIVFFITTVFIIGGCKKFLDKRPDNIQSTPTTLADLQALLDNPSQMTGVITPSYSQASDDDYFLRQNSFNAVPGFWQQAYKWTPFDYYHQNDWSKGYGAIYVSNLCLETIKNIEKTISNKDQWNNVKGSAHFFRAYHFLQLTWAFAKSFDASSSNSDLGICLRLTSDFNEPSIRSSVMQSYEQVISDAKESVSYLPDLPLHVIRPSKTAAYALLARCYLSMRNYDSAYRYANLALAIKSNLMDFKTDITPSSSAPFKRYDNPETIFYTEINTTINLFATNRGLIDTAITSSYATTDIRRSAFLASSSGYHSFKGMYTASTSRFFSGLATDELYLIKAECLARGLNGAAGDKDAAMSTLNVLLSKRHNNSFNPLVAGSPEEALNKILIERRKELLMRGIRWSDLKRLNKEGKNITLTRVISGSTFTLQPNANYYALPLPTDIINITGIPQNVYP